MFRRKDESDPKPTPATEKTDDLSKMASAAKPTVSPINLAKPPVTPAATPTTAPTMPAAAAPAAPAAAPVAARPAIDMPRRVAETPAASASTAQRRNETEMRKLIVGREICLSGEITSCDRLVVEGSVEANLVGCKDIDIAESGLFKGSASIDDAEIRGRFEGVLTVKGRLLIRATGKVIGTIRYGQIEIECGGQISGDVQATQGNEAMKPTALASVG
jgi:cytoskeletal protein CcmA (bactofilin family)